MYLYDNGEKIHIPSQYLKTYKENIRNIHERKAWKQKGMTAAMGYDGLFPQEIHQGDQDNFKITGLTHFGKSKSLIYAIRIDQMGGIFKVNPYDPAESEGHIYHDKGVVVNNLVYNRLNKTLLYSLSTQSGQENIALHNLKTGVTGILTEGDSIDSYPRWVQGSKEEIVFQSAGIGRSQAGVVAGLSPVQIHSMTINSTDIHTLLKYDHFDCLAPIMDEEKNLYYIRRPYKSDERPSGNIFSDIIMFPFRMINALFHFLNIFSMRYSGKPLSTGINPARNDGDPKKLVIHGNLIDAAKLIEDAQKNDKKQLGIVPRSWKLVKHRPDGSDEILSDGVIAFDRTENGTLVCCNGREIYTLDEDGIRTSVLKEKFIEKVFAW